MLEGMDELYRNILPAGLFVIFITILRRIFFMKDTGQLETKIHFQETSTLAQKIVSRCNILNERYVPATFWGKSGHVQSILLSIFGRFGKIPRDCSTRHTLTTDDGSTVSYDMFKVTPSEGKNASQSSLKELIVCVPGICNHSETNYIRAFARNMNSRQYDVAVLNHTGALKDVQLTKPKIFTYGDTGDLDAVVRTLYKREQRKMIAVGFSLGGNILMKYLGESEKNQQMFHFAICVCQGYNLLECCDLMQEWENHRWVYNYMLTRNMLKVINSHQELFDKYCETKKRPVKLDWQKIRSSRSLQELDEEFSMKVYEKNNLKEWYENCSSSRYMQQIKIPTLLLNSRDDPLIPESLFKYPKQLVEKNHNALFVVPPYGGHLGFFEGDYIVPNSVSWLDKLLMDFCDVTVDVLKEEKLY